MAIERYKMIQHSTEINPRNKRPKSPPPESKSAPFQWKRMRWRVSVTKVCATKWRGDENWKGHPLTDDSDKRSLSLASDKWQFAMNGRLPRPPVVADEQLLWLAHDPVDRLMIDTLPSGPPNKNDDFPHSNLMMMTTHCHSQLPLSMFFASKLNRAGSKFFKNSSLNSTHFQVHVIRI